MFVEQGFHFGQQVGQVTLAFRHGQATGRQGHAGNAVLAQGAECLAGVQAVFFHQRIDLLAVGAFHIGNHHVLVAGQQEFAGVDGGNFAQAGLPQTRVITGIPQPPRFHVQAQVP